MIHAISIPHHNGSSARPLWSLRSLSLPKRLARANKEAAPIILSGPYADGITDQSHLLPLTVMASHVNLPATDHPEMAPDKDRFPSCFLALRAKTLSCAKFDLDFYFHIRNKFYYLLESWERLVKSTSSALSQNKRSLCLSTGRRSVTLALESAQNFMKIKIRHKDKHSFRICKTSPLRLGNFALPYEKQPIPVPNTTKLRFGTADGPFPCGIRRALVAAPLTENIRELFQSIC